MNTWREEIKQMSYAAAMGIAREYGQWPSFDLGGRSVLDIGGGPVSMLLKTINGGRLTVVDPAPYPDWVRARYEAHGIEFVQQDAEDYWPDDGYDECWIYNVLQHVVNPEKVARVAMSKADNVRVFEWVNIPADEMHPHVLTAASLEQWFDVGESVYGVNQAWGESPAMAWVLRG